ncbi:MAG: hypothetical protein [Arizlama microvirus]|nr:MAG: hypothetical protein [Arizlama microvirus]
MSEITISEDGTVQLAAALRRKLSITVVSNGCTIADEWGQLLYAGVGKAKIKVNTPTSALLVQVADGGTATLSIPELRTSEPGWTFEPSMTDLEPKQMGAISPEIQAVMDHMNRNAIIREQAMLRALGKRQQ